MSFRSSNLSVAVVDEYGLITAVGKGYATITVSCGDAVAFCEVTVGSGTGQQTGGDTSVDQPDNPTQDTLPQDPEHEVCADCGGSGSTVCRYCDGEYNCKDCGGSGVDPSADKACTVCGGDGMCSACGGDGKMSRGECSICDGTGDRSYCNGTGDCGHCYGMGYSAVGDVDCHYCTDGECRSCGGKGEWKCTTCNGSGECSYCDYGYCPACGG